MSKDTFLEHSLHTFFCLLSGTMTRLVVRVQRVEFSPLGSNQLHKSCHRHFRVFLEHERSYVIGVELVARPLSEVFVRVIKVHIVQAVLGANLVRRQLQHKPV